MGNGLIYLDAAAVAAAAVALVVDFRFFLFIVRGLNAHGFAYRERVRALGVRRWEFF